MKLDDSFYKRKEDLKKVIGYTEMDVSNVNLLIWELNHDIHAHTVRECLLDNPRITIMTSKELREDLDVLSSFDVVIRQTTGTVGNINETKVVKEAIIKAKGTNTVFIDAVGNNNLDLNKYSRDDWFGLWITVGAVNYIPPNFMGTSKAGYSNFGDKVVPFAYYPITSGTSYANPFFANNVIRMKAMFPELHQSEVIEILKNNIEREIKGFKYGLPRLIKEEDIMKISKEIPILDIINPVKNARITSGYGKRIHPISKKEEFHRGIDLVGDRSIQSATDGKVIRNQFIEGFGYSVYIQHKDYYFIYAHLKERPMHLAVGQNISQGDYLGEMGMTGTATGVHLHFEIRQGRFPNFTSFDIKKILDNGGKKVEDNTSEWAKEHREKLMELGVTDGTRPQDQVTREELWTMLGRLLNETNK